MGVEFGVVGALVPELLLDARPLRMTNDVDVVVIVDSLADFDRLKVRLADFGFSPTRVPHRLQHRAGGLLDVLPFSENVAPGGRLELGEDVVLNDRFDSADADVVGTVLREEGSFFVDDERRTEIYELFRWFRLGIGV